MTESTSKNKVGGKEGRWEGGGHGTVRGVRQACLSQEGTIVSCWVSGRVERVPCHGVFGAVRWVIRQAVGVSWGDRWGQVGAMSGGGWIEGVPKQVISFYSTSEHPTSTHLPCSLNSPPLPAQQPTLLRQIPHDTAPSRLAHPPYSLPWCPLDSNMPAWHPSQHQ